MKKKNIAIFRVFGFVWEFQMRKKAIPINRYSSTHTGPNSQLGGLKVGFCKLVYHVETELLVKNPPMIPANWQIKMDMTNLIIIFFTGPPD
jgi:hypothetical protein